MYCREVNRGASSTALLEKKTKILSEDLLLQFSSKYLYYTDVIKEFSIRVFTVITLKVFVKSYPSTPDTIYSGNVLQQTFNSLTCTFCNYLALYIVFFFFGGCDNLDDHNGLRLPT